ncbi:MAG TPA: MFS transporter [Candidatus Acidoferrum sp.]|nr:MFS transporter [Candidatus Acidoferrum sp.]
MPRRRWRMAFLLAFGVIISFFDRINLSVSQDALHDSFGLSLIAFGYLASAFSWTYAIMQMPAGILLDRFGVRRVGRVSTLLWSISSFAAAISPGLGVFFAARFLLGVAEAPTFPGNAKAIGHWFPQQERSLAISITDAAAKFSSAIGVPFLGLLLLHFGWRFTFATTGFLSLLYFALFYLLYRNPQEDTQLSRAELHYITEGAPQTETQTEAKGASSLWYLLTQRKVYGLALGWGAYNYSFFLLLNWLPSYLSIAHHMDLLHSAFYTSAPWLFATFTDIVVGGWLVDALIQRGWNANRVRQSVLIVGTAFGLAIFGAAHSDSSFAALCWISLALGGLAAAAPVAWTVPSLIAPRDSVGTLASIANLSGQLAAISAPIITGYIVSATHSFDSAFVTAAVILFVGIAGYAFLLGQIERIPEPAG